MDTRSAAVDARLVVSARAGDAQAFDRLVARWHPRLLRHARRLTGDADAARDVTQDTWVAIVRGLGRLREPATFGPWALRITPRRCADWIGHRQAVRAWDTAVEPTSAAPSASAVSSDDGMRLREALRRLDRDERVLLSLFYIEGYAVTEIAQILGIPAGTVKSRLFNARATLRTALEVRNEQDGRC